MSNKRYWQKTKGTKNFMKIVWKRLEVMIRFATEEDAEELLRIYSYYVENTAITFEYDTPALDEFKYRIRTIKAMYPYLISEATPMPTHLRIGQPMIGQLKQQSI